MAIFTNIIIIIGQSVHKAGYTSSLYGCPCVDSMVTCGTDNVFKLIKRKASSQRRSEKMFIHNNHIMNTTKTTTIS